MKNTIFDLIIRFNKDEVPSLASQLAYKLILSFFPFLIFLITLMGYTSVNGMDVVTGMRSMLPENVYNLISSTLIEVNRAKHSSLLSLSLIFTLWAASSGFNAVIKGLNKAYGVKENRSFIRVRIVSLLCTIGMATVIIVMALLLVFSKVIWNVIAHQLPALNKLIVVWVMLKYLIVITTAVFIFSALYRYAPNKKLSWKEVFPGSIFSTMSLILASGIFAYYVNNFGRYSIVYGSLGAIIFLIIWLFLISMIIILGGEVNASLVSRGKTIHIRTFKISG